jgi:hypothetical protein
MAHPFFIGFVGRSGSGAIMTDLAQHPQVKMRGEALSSKTLKDGREMNDDIRVEWMRRWWSSQRKACGFKYQFNVALPQFDDLDRLERELKEQHVVIFRLGRRDRVRHAVGALRTQQLLLVSGGIGHVRTDGPEELHEFRRSALTIDPAAFREMVAGIGRSVAYMDAFLGRFAEVTSLWYEDYLNDHLAVLNAITAAVDVEPFPEAPPETHQKISDNDLRKAVANYDEIAEEARRLGLPIE